MEELIQKMPKVELHAHLNGSLCSKSIQTLGEFVHGGQNSQAFIESSCKWVNFSNLTMDECFKKFKFVHELTATKRGLEEATLLVIKDFAVDNVCYLELRTTPKANEHMSKREYLECVLTGIAKSQLIHGGLTVKLVPSIDRSQSVAAAEETLSVVLELLEAHSDVIVGIDLSGDPSRGFFRDFKPVLERARQNGLKLALHCAEIDNPSEIADMLEFKMERCGHGTFLSKEQLNLLGQRNVPVECCLTSNVKCGTVGCYDDHHFRLIFEAQHPVVLCTDDMGVFDTSLSQEFSLARKTFSLTENDLQRLSLNAVEHAFGSDAEKQRIRDVVLKFFS